MSPLAQILAVANRQAPSPPQPTIQPTNVAGIYANNDAQNMAKYQAQLAQQNAQFGGLASLGSAAIGAGGKALAGGAGGSGIASSLGLGSGISDADLIASLALV
jgi:hypothetical protein